MVKKREFAPAAVTTLVLVASATLVVTGALLLVTRSY